MYTFIISFSTSLVLFTFCSIMPSVTQAQSTQTSEQLRGQFDTSNKEFVYTKLMEQGEPGYRVICDLFAAGKIGMNEWINWEYDYATRMDAPNVGKSVDDYVYTTSKNEKGFLTSMSKAYAKSDLPNRAFVEMMQDEREGARLLGYSVIQNRYKDVPTFTAIGSKAQRTDELSLIEKFLASKAEK